MDCLEDPQDWLPNIAGYFDPEREVLPVPPIGLVSGGPRREYRPTVPKVGQDAHPFRPTQDGQKCHPLKSVHVIEKILEDSCRPFIDMIRS